MKKLLNIILAWGVLFVVLFLAPVTSFAATITFFNITDATNSGARALTALPTAPSGYTSGFSFAPFTAAGFQITAAPGLTSGPSLLINDVALTDLLTATGLAITPTGSGNGDILEIVYSHTFVNGLEGNKLYSARGAGNIVGANASGQTFTIATIGCFLSSCGTTPNDSLPTLPLPINAVNNYSATLANQTRNCDFGTTCTQTLRGTVRYDFETNETLRAPGSFSTLGAYDGDGMGADRMAGLQGFLAAGEAVPEPTTILLLGGGLLFLGWVGRKRLLAR